jgi:hypothetical protein
LSWLRCWWHGLSGEAKAAIIAAVVSPIIAAVLGVRVRVVRWLYIRTLEKLDKAKEEIRQERRASLGAIIPLDEDEDEDSFPILTEQVAEKANVRLWLAKKATRWHERTMKYGA